MTDFLTTGLQLVAAAEKGEKHAHSSFFGMMVYLGIVLVIVFSVLVVAKKGLNRRYFTNFWTQRMEQLYIFVENLCLGIIGPRGKKYMPMLMTFWLIIFVGNIVALFFPTSITADLGFNLGLALLAMGYVQWEGMKQNGVLGHFAHFAGPKLGIFLLPISLMLFLIEILSELMKNLSLSLRLYGNIDGGHRASDAMNALGKKLGGFDWFNIPFGAFMLPIKLLTCVVQAMIFCLLLCVYISLVTHEPHEHHDDEHGTDPVPAH